MKYGEYIRTNSGYIGKLKRIEFDEIDKFLKWYVYDKKEPDINITKEVYINKPYIVNHSKDPKDLIQVGDIVEIYDVLNEDVIYIWNQEMLKAVKEDVSNGIRIKRILTKEQYEQNVFEVVE